MNGYNFISNNNKKLLKFYRNLLSRFKELEDSLSIVIQGPLNRRSIDTIPYYLNYGKVIVSCWDTDDLSMLDKYKNKKVDHGIIAEYQCDGEYKYLYSDEYLKSNECYNNINEKIKNYDNTRAKFNKLIYWELNLMNIQRETFNEDMWQNIVPKINDFWQKVETFKLMPIEDNIKKFKFLDEND